MKKVIVKTRSIILTRLAENQDEAFKIADTLIFDLAKIKGELIVNVKFEDIF